METVNVAGPGVAERMLRGLYTVASAVPTERLRGAALHYLWRARRKLHPPGTRSFVRVPLPPDVSLVVNLAENVGADLFYGLGFESLELDLFRHVLRPGSTVFDVGANIGVYTLTASRLASSVHAFEPIPEIHYLLRHNVASNGAANVVLNELAASDSAGTVELFVNADSALTSMGRTARGDVVRVQTIRTITLDEYASSKGIETIDYLKIDVEGFEGHVLRGASALLDRSPDLTVFCELAEKNFAPLGFSVAEVLRFMNGKGYRTWEIDPRRGIFGPLAPGAALSNQNVVFVRPDGAAEQRVREFIAKGNVR